MTKNTALTIFMVVLVIGMVMEETQGDTCHEYLYPEKCENNQCNSECATKFKEVGVFGFCVPPRSEPTEQFCICSYNC
ncbi:putative defensin-like protein 129 [Arabidopsis thaliana]